MPLQLPVASPFDLGPHARLISRIMVGIIGREIEQDLDVWTYKTYLHAPKLAKVRSSGSGTSFQVQTESISVQCSSSLR